MTSNGRGDKLGHGGWRLLTFSGAVATSAYDEGCYLSEDKAKARSRSVWLRKEGQGYISDPKLNKASEAVT